jgi:hypothetical protein
MEEMILYLIYGFGMVTCTVSALSRFTKIVIMANMKNSKSHGKQEVDVQ